jgi:hypothetical protein
MAKANDVMELIKGMTVLELKELNDMIKDEFGVTRRTSRKASRRPKRSRSRPSWPRPAPRSTSSRDPSPLSENKEASSSDGASSFLPG